MNSKQPKISVIVPMYNSEKTIDECLDSIIAQTIFPDIELLIIDDCSTDLSFSKAKSYEERYPDNILLINGGVNGGPGYARNIGLSYANGDYIGFVDSDDAIYPTMYEKLYEQARLTNSDFADSGFYDQLNDRAILYTSDDLTGNLDGIKRSQLIASVGYVVTKIYRRDFLTTNHITFREVYMLEDMDFLIEVFCKALRCSNIKETMYVYRNSPNSLSKGDNLQKYISYHSQAMLAVYKKCSILNVYPEVQSATEAVMLRLYLYMIRMCLHSVYVKDISQSNVVPLIDTIRTLKVATIHHNYDNPFVIKSFSKEDILIMKKTDISALDVLSLQSP